MPGNFLAHSMLWVWLLVTLATFAVARPRIAAIVSILGGVLLLPSGVVLDLPPLPPLDRDGVIGLAALLGMVLFARRTFAQRIPGTGVDFLILLFVVSEFATALTNTDPLVFSEGQVVRPGLAMYDGLSAAVGQALRVAAPFVIGRALFRAPRDLELLLKAVVFGAVLYSPLVLFELRFSPQMHNIVYGFFPHSFAQTVRNMGWGWRPMVFMTHGLMLALFFASASLAASGLWSIRARIGPVPARLAAVYVLILLLLCNSLGAAIYGLAALPLLLAARPRTTLRVAVILATLVFAYPILRATDWFPVEFLVHTAQFASEDRAESLAFRFKNEDLLMERAAERPLFGWGRFGRNHVFDPMIGRAVTTTDGLWIILYGSQGVLGFATLFGAWLLPVFLLSRRLRNVADRRSGHVVATTALIVAVNALDLLPNAFMNPFTLLMAGALAGTAETLRLPRRTVYPRRRHTGAESKAGSSTIPRTSLGSKSRAAAARVATDTFSRGAATTRSGRPAPHQRCGG
jgi:hypothetical protein